MHLVLLERKGAGLFFWQLLQCAHSPPHGRGPDARHIARRHQQLGLIRLQSFSRSGGFRPPHEATLGEPLLRQPISLAVIGEQTDRRPAAAPEHEYAPGKRIFLKLVLAKPGERIDSLSSVHRFDRHQYAHLRRDLNHLSASRQARSRLVQSGGAVVFHWMRILLPPEDSTSITHSSRVAGCGAISSTNAGWLVFRGRLGAAVSRFFSPI